MQTIKPILFCSFVLAVLSTTQMDAFARGGHHGGHGGFGGGVAAKEDRGADSKQVDDSSKYHAVLDHSNEADRSSGFTTSSGFVTSSGFTTSSDLKEKGPEMITLDNGIEKETGIDGNVQGFAHEDDVAAVHPESKTQKKQKPKSESCWADPGAC